MIEDNYRGKSTFALKLFEEFEKKLKLKNQIINIKIIGDEKQGMSSFSRNILRD